MMVHYKNLDLNDIVYFCETDNIFKKEEWRVIDFYDNYKISDLGRVKVNDKKILKDRIKKGYNTCVLSKYNIPKQIRIHRLVAFSFIQNTENKPKVNHKDCNKLNNYKNNLEWCTVQENTIHSYLNGMQKSRVGKYCNLTKLTEEQVIEIKKLYSIRNISYAKIGVIYNVKGNAIRDILLGKKWKYLKL